jgi:beta-phosphoglucomutase
MTRPYDAIVFDLDGVICHTDVYHYRGWKSIADDLGIPFDETVNNRLRGVSRMESLEIMLEPYEGETLTDERKLDLAAIKNERYREMLGDMSPADLDPSVRATLDDLRGRGLKLAIGSSSKNAKFILERIGLDDYFDAISDGTNISRSKPDPEVFLKAAEYLGIDPARCVVIEDAVAGIEAGLAAGMYTVSIGDAADQGAGDAKLGTFADLATVMTELGCSRRSVADFFGF